MIEILVELIQLNDTPDNIFGYPDNMKLQSSMTLFALSIKNESVFQDILDKFYEGKRDTRTLELIKQSN